MKCQDDIAHFFQGFHQDGAGLTEKGLPYLFTAGQGACVGRDGSGARFREAPLIDDHRLPAVDLFHPGEQEPPVFHALQIHGDDPGFLVIVQIIQKIGTVQSQSITVTDGLAEMDTVMACQIIRKILGVAPALTDQGNRTAFRGGGSPGQKPGFRDIKPHAVWADNAKAALKSNGFHFLL